MKNLTYYEIDNAVNYTKNHDPSLIEPINMFEKQVYYVTLRDGPN